MNTNTRSLLPRFTVSHKDQGKGYDRLLFNLLAFLIVTTALMLIACGANEMTAPISVLKHDPIILDPTSLFQYSLRTVLRMFIAVVFSLIFSLIYATAAAKSRRAEQILIPLLDVLQSVPILGYISFTVTAFLALFPGSMMGAECAAIFAIFTSQAWNMTFSFYQTLKTVPKELLDASIIFKMSSWQRFWRVEVPYGIPSLVWNTAVSMSGGWFFVVAAEVITVGNNQITLPGIGSYIALALEQKNILAILYAIIAMVSVIMLYNQFLLRPLVVWSDRFRYEMTTSRELPKSWVFSLFRKSEIIAKLFLPISYIARFILYLPILNKRDWQHLAITQRRPDSLHTISNYLWYSLLFAVGLISCYSLFHFLYHNIGVDEIITVCKLASITMLRVLVLILLASIIWAPIGIYIGLHPKLAAIIQPIAQFLAAFPANLLFPVAVIVISRYDLNPNIWLSPLMIMGTQWYILFNVIAGSASFPNDLKEAAKNLNVKGWLWWRKVILPAITPYFVTGAITASGGAWNASIIAEVVTYGDKTINAVGLGSYITQMTINADFHRIVLGIGVMSLCVVLFNRLFWQPIYDFSVQRFQL